MPGPSIGEFESKLHDSGLIPLRADYAEKWIAEADVRRIEVRRIGQVEAIGADLKLQLFSKMRAFAQ